MRHDKNNSGAVKEGNLKRVPGNEAAVAEPAFLNQNMQRKLVPPYFQP